MVYYCMLNKKGENMKKYIIRNNKKLIVGKARKLTLEMKAEDLTPEYPEIEYSKVEYKNGKWIGLEKA